MNKNDINNIAVPKKPSLFHKIVAKVPWEIVLRWTLFVVGVAALTALFPHGGTSKYSDLKLNLISSREIIAPFDFEILKTDEQLDQERRAARASVLPVFERSKATAETRLTQLDSLWEEMNILLFSETYSNSPDSILAAELNAINAKYRINLSGDILQIDKELLTAEWLQEFITPLRQSLLAAYTAGILDRDPAALNTSTNSIVVISSNIERVLGFISVSDKNQSKKFILDKLKNSFAENDIRIKMGYEIALNLLEPNLIYHEDLTEIRRTAEEAKVALAKGIVLKDERIIDSNERVTQVHLDKLRSLDVKRRELAVEESGISKILPLLGKILFSAGLLFIFGYFVFHYRREITQTKNFLLLLILLLSPLVFLQLIIESAGISKILFPSALASMLVTIFFGYRIAFWFLLVMALFAGAMQGNEYQLTMLSLIVGSAGIVSVKSIRSRTQLLTAALYLLIAHLVFVTAFNFMQFSISEGFFQQIGIAVLNSGLTPIFVLGFAIILGNIFDITTDLTLLELSDLNRPLLKQLAATAPGTYHHSLMVGTLSEVAAEAVGANPLLARTASYYHDIGKIEKRDYFIENQVVFNPHDTIPPEESAKVLNSHVRDGLEMAEKHRLPQVIKDAITQHHGTGLMQYFYVKAMKKQGDGVHKSTYKYPGPLPVSKESGIIMLADSVEAAVRSMGKAPADEIRGRVQKIIESKFAEGQLDNCELSLHDLQTVEDNFVKTLLAQSHQRIAYPSRAETEDLEHEHAPEN